jgi:RNA polymerase sigma-70 factor (ECF subfamily)
VTILRSEIEGIEVDGGGLDAPVLDALYRRYAGWLKRTLDRRFGRSLGDGAEDLVHETYIRIAPMGAAGQIRHPRALLLKVAVNLAHDRVRQLGRARTAEALIEATAEKADTWGLVDQDAALLLKQAVLSLPRPLRDVFMLSRFAGLPNQEIARSLGLAVKTVEWRMTRALALLAERMRD